MNTQEPTTMDTDPFSTIMTELDDMKDQLGDGAYLSLCNRLANAKKKSETSVMYRATYITVEPTVTSSGKSIVQPLVQMRIVEPTSFFGLCQSYADQVVSRVTSEIQQYGYSIFNDSFTIRPLINIPPADDEEYDGVGVGVEVGMASTYVIISFVRAN